MIPNVNMEMASIHTGNITKIHLIPTSIINRPIVSILQEQKVASIMETLKNPKTRRDVPPVDVIWIESTKEERHYYFSFGGCHRFEAFERLAIPAIPCKLFKATREDLVLYLGSSAPVIPE